MKACYVHVPFCKDICAYCDFTRCRYQKQLADKWLSKIQQEINHKLNGEVIDTLYIGGGTPTALSNEQFYALLQTLYPFIKKVNEYTIEANIDSLTENKVKIMKQYGVNRISLGVQTLQPPLLKCIHRTHTIQQIKDCIQLLKKHGIKNISIDLIYGLPEQTLKMWEDDLHIVLREFDITHVSLYALTIEDHSEFGRKHIVNIDSEIETQMYETAIQTLENVGFHQYEISNFAKEKCESKHNQVYWKYDDFIGIGCGASGKQQHCRYENTNNLHTYITKGATPNVIELNKEEEMFEMIMMSLRMRAGLSLSSFEKKFNRSFLEEYQEPFTQQLHKNMLYQEGDFIKVTYEGMLLLNDVLLAFL